MSFVVAADCAGAERFFAMIPEQHVHPSGEIPARSFELESRGSENGPRKLYYILKQAYSNKRDYAGIVTVLHRVVAAGYRPFAADLLDLYKDCGCIDKAEAVFRRMADEGVTPSAVHWNQLLFTYLQANDRFGATLVVDRIRQARIPEGKILMSLFSHTYKKSTVALPDLSFFLKPTPAATTAGSMPSSPSCK